MTPELTCCQQRNQCQKSFGPQTLSQSPEAERKQLAEDGSPRYKVEVINVIAIYIAPPEWRIYALLATRLQIPEVGKGRGCLSQCWWRTSRSKNICLEARRVSCCLWREGGERGDVLSAILAVALPTTSGSWWRMRLGDCASNVQTDLLGERLALYS